MKKQPRFAKNGRVDTSYNSASRYFITIPYSEVVNYLPNHESTLIQIEGILGDLAINFDVRFTAFGDSVRFNFETNTPFNVHFGNGILSNDVKIVNNSFIDFIFDGDNFIPVLTTGTNLIGSTIKNAGAGAILYANSSSQGAQDSNHFYYDENRKYLAIGNNTPQTHLSICGNSNNGQIHIMNNDMIKNESSIGFGRFGNEPLWVIGAGVNNTDLNVFSLYNTQTGKQYILTEANSEVSKIKKNNKQ